MPITQSATKALRQSLKKQVLNLKKKVKYKSAVKEFKKSIAVKDFKKAQSLLPKVYKALDKAAKTNVIKKGKSNRLKSRLSRSLTASAEAKKP